MVFNISRESASIDTARPSDFAPTSALKVKIAWVASQPIAQVRQTLTELLSMLAEGKLTTPATKRYPMTQFKDAIHLADGESGQQKILLDFSA
jgi:NADPH:quinone reductase-like Zn-dependent oxidoreductase